MKKPLLFLALVFVCVICVSAQKKFSILGDSYSTFEGYVSPKTNGLWYYSIDNPKKKDNDVDYVDQTWWRILAKEHNMIIDTNNSYSGTTICHTGYGQINESYCSFVSRIFNVGDPDILFIFGGSNDSWAGSPIGEYKYEK